MGDQTNEFFLLQFFVSLGSRRLTYPNAFEKFVNVAVNVSRSTAALNGVVENIPE